MNALADQPIDCWSRIGISGDRSCVELAKWSVCANCPVFIDSGKALFEVAPPPGYLSQWSEVLAQDPAQRRGRLESVVVFGLHGEWLGLRTGVFVGIDEYRRPRPVPHRTNRVFLGLLAVEGRIHLGIDLGELLGIPRRDTAPTGAVRAKLMIIEANGQSVAFPVTEVLGVFQLGEHEGKAPPSTLVKALPSFTGQIFQLDGKQVGLLDARQILDHLRESVLA